MNESTKSATPGWFKVLNGLFLVWNLFGLAIFVMTMTVFRSREALEKADMNEEQIELILNTPGWVNVAFGVAVIFGVLGTLALVLRKKLATPLLVLSLLGVLAQNTYVFFMSDTLKIMGPGASPFVIAVAVFLVPYSIVCGKKGWLQ